MKDLQNSRKEWSSAAYPSEQVHIVINDEPI